MMTINWELQRETKNTAVYKEELGPSGPVNGRFALSINLPKGLPSHITSTWDERKV